MRTDQRGVDRRRPVLIEAEVEGTGVEPPSFLLADAEDFQVFIGCTLLRLPLLRSSWPFAVPRKGRRWRPPSRLRQS
jgi:hypothetical protein